MKRTPVLIPTTDESQIEQFDKNNSSIQHLENYENTFIKIDVNAESSCPDDVKIKKQAKNDKLYQFILKKNTNQILMKYARHKSLP